MLAQHDQGAIAIDRTVQILSTAVHRDHQQAGELADRTRATGWARLGMRRRARHAT